MIFFMDDGGRPDIVAKAFIVILRSLQSCSIRLRTAVTVFIIVLPYVVSVRDFICVCRLCVILLGYA